MAGRRGGGVAVALALTACLVLAACQGETRPDDADAPAGAGPGDDGAGDDGSGSGTVTLAFAGDVHFEGGLEGVPDRPRSTLGPLSASLRDADVAVANLESAVATGGSPAAKELEEAGNRFWFRSPPAALDVLARSGVDVASVANNHGADYGRAGLAETLRAARGSKVDVVGVGRTPAGAFRPSRTTVGDVEVAVLAADDSFLESEDPIWDVAPGAGPGIARDQRRLLGAVARAGRTADVVAVYLHWGDEYVGCPTRSQRDLAARLAEAGADVVVGAHAHVALGAGLLDDTYVSYGLGNFYWYTGGQPQTGVLRVRLRVADGEAAAVADRWVPGEIPPEGGAPQPVTGAGGAAAVRDWRALRGCTDLAPGPSAGGTQRPGPGTPGGEDGGNGGDADDPMPAYASTVRPLGSEQRRRMIGNGHEPARCPVPLDDLRMLTTSYVGFDGEAHTGRIVVRRRYAADLDGVFRELYRERFPLRRMRPIDVYGGDDDASMAADNSSAYNCRRVAGQASLSDHAYGAAVDLNPVENPYVTASGVLPPAGRRFVDVDRSAGADAARGVVVDGGVAVRAFERIGWQWGGVWNEPDYQHFYAP